MPGFTVRSLIVVGWLSRKRPLRFAMVVMSLFLSVRLALGDLRILLHASRTYFGFHRVYADRESEHRYLYNGITLHGVQSRHQGKEDSPLTYYSRSSGIGLIFEALQGSNRTVGLVGLGTGTLATYGHSSDRFRIFEINSQIVRVAADPLLFTYLTRSKARLEIIEGDSRHTMNRGHNMVRVRQVPDAKPEPGTVPVLEFEGRVGLAGQNQRLTRHSPVDQHRQTKRHEEPAGSQRGDSGEPESRRHERMRVPRT